MYPPSIFINQFQAEHTVMQEPLTKLALWEHKKQTTFATSMVCPLRPIGVASITGVMFSRTNSSGASRPRFVSMTPGQTALTRIPCLAYSIPPTFVKPAMACLDATYFELNGGEGYYPSEILETNQTCRGCNVDDCASWPRDFGTIIS